MLLFPEVLVRPMSVPVHNNGRRKSLAVATKKKGKTRTRKGEEKLEVEEEEGGKEG